jgi:hypothetical protein
VSTARTAVLAATSAAMAAAGIAAAPAAAQPVPLTERPHSKIVTDDRGEVHVRRLTMSVPPSADRLHANVVLDLRNESGHPVRRELRIGPCNGGAPVAPVCAIEKTIRVRLAAGQSHTYVARTTLRRPPTVPGVIQAALVRPGARQPYAYRSDGLLLLTAGAWRGTGAGRLYGVRLGADDDVRRLLFDVPLVARDRAYVDVNWHGASAPAAVPTTVSQCAGVACTWTTLAPARRRSGPGEFGNRFYVDRNQADALGLRAGAPGQPPLLEATLPWPA